MSALRSDSVAAELPELPAELPDPWRGLQPAIRAADLFLVNSESTATDRPLSQKANPSGKPECDDTNLLPKGCTKDLRIGTKIAPSFKAGGVDFVALSNNHQVIVFSGDCC